jgi:hypothetical protein
MSGNIRTILTVGFVVIGSWTAVRSLAASPEQAPDDPPISVTATKRAELKDASLAEVIHQFAKLARLGNRASTTP